jgi:hypothetical protein
MNTHNAKTRQKEITMETLIINGIEYVRKDAAPQLCKNPDGMPFAIVRCLNAGVHAGYVASRKDGVVTLIKSRRLWRWWSKATLSELAIEGPLRSKITEQKYGCVLPSLDLTESDVCEVIPCTEAAERAIIAVPVWQAAS